MLKAKREESDDLSPQETQEWLDALDDVIDAAAQMFVHESTHFKATETEIANCGL